MGFGDIISSVLGGGVTGLLGAVITRYADYKQAQLNIQISAQNNQHEIDMKQIDFDIMKEEWAGRDRVAFTEGEAAKDVADSKAFAESFQLEPKTYANISKVTKAQNAYLVFVDGIRGVTRPALTLYLCGVTTAVYMQAGSIIKTQALSTDQSVQIYEQISSTILYLTTTVILWWFGTRNKEQSKRNNGANNG